MTPVQMEYLLHCFYCPEPFPRDSQSFQDAHDRLLAEKLIERSETYSTREADVYMTTPRGDMMVRALEEVPLPIPASGWVMPDPYPTPDK